jgi:hypothetical protein
MFPHLEADFNGRRFCDATEIIKNATKELKSFHKMASKMFPTRLQSLAEVYICTRGINCRVFYFSEMK